MSEYYLENVQKQHQQHPRKFTVPTPEELAHLSIGDQVRLIFVFNQEKEDGCRAERIWVTVTSSIKDTFSGHLDNQPKYLTSIQKNDMIRFTKRNIATVFDPTPLSFDLQQYAVVSMMAIEKREINWTMKLSPSDDTDSGWQCFYGEEDTNYLDNPDNFCLLQLEDILTFEPLLKTVFDSEWRQYSFDEDTQSFVPVSI